VRHPSTAARLSSTHAGRPSVARLAAALLVVLIGASACSGAGRDTVTVVPKSGEPIDVSVELATTPQQRELGLMYRDSLGPTSGMLFVFPKKAHQSFWMRNTRIPHDIVYIEDDGRIARIHRKTTPYSEAGLPSGVPIRFVLEVEGGFSEKHGLTEGDRVDLGPLAATPSS
jgi:uncharacterized membrane protein (UPF0127 family)